MPRTPSTRLNAKNVLTLGPGEYRDLTLPLFVLRVRESGGRLLRTYGLRYGTGGSGRAQRVKIGDALTLSLEDARAEARRLLAGVYTGETPKALLATEAARSRTVLELGTLCLADLQLSDASRRDWTRRLLSEIKPAIGNIPAPDLTPEHVEAMLRPKVKAAPISANRLFEFTRRIYSWAVKKRLLTHSPIAGMTRPTEDEPSSDRVLSYPDELLALARALDDMQDGAAAKWRNGKARKTADPKPRRRRLSDRLPSTSAMGDAVSILMLTGVRRRSVLMAQPGEFEGLDTDAARWVIPAAHTKMGHAHVVPLSRQAATIISRRIKATRDFAYLFPRTRIAAHRRAPVMTWSSRWIDELCRRMNAHLGREAATWTIHNLRHTMATHMEEQLGIREKVVALILGHTHGGRATRIYGRAELIKERREALQAYADWLDAARRATIKAADGVAG